MKERRKLAHERRRNIAVGLTSLAGLIGLVVLLTAFGYVPVLFKSGYTVTVYMDNISGLRPNSRVTLWGRDIGEVVAVGFTEDGAPERAYVRVRVDERFEIPRDVRVRVETPLFGGGPVVALVDGDTRAGVLAMDGSAELASVKVINPAAELESVSEDISGLAANVNALLAGEEPGEPSLTRVVLKLEGRLDELETVLAGAEQWLGNDALRDDVGQAASNARELTESLGETVAALEERYLALADAAESRLEKVDSTLGSAEQTLDNVGASIAEIETRYVALADDAAQVVAVIDKLVAQADSKDGTIGLLLSDPQLYHNLSDTSERLKLMIDEARLLVEKWKAEGVPLRVFN